MQKKTLILFLKNPIPGKVKTRIARDLGDESALKIYQQLLAQTYKILLTLKSISIHVYYSDFIEPNDIFSNVSTRIGVQAGKDLGERMLHCFMKSFANNIGSVVMIGSDCYNLSKKDIKMAFKVLTEKEVVIGPALDGGYYLLGMNRLIPELFKDMSWSTKKLLLETTRKLKGLNISYGCLKELNDIDTIDDLPAELLNL